VIDNIIKFPRPPCREVHSRKQRRSKYGTPEERAAKRAAAKARRVTAGNTPQISELDREYLDRHFNNFHNPSVADPPFVGFLRQLGGYIVKEFATGKEIDRIFDELIAEATQTGRRR
jgi:hypothetical protein